MVRLARKSLRPWIESAFNYSYVVLAIALLMTAGVTLTYYQHCAAFNDPDGQWVPVVALIGLCASLLLFGMTHREAIARAVLNKKTADLLDVQKQNHALLKAEKESRIAAEQANQAKDEFLAIVSHELRTPLNAIAGWNRVLGTPGIPSETRQTALAKIDKNLRRQASIIEELLNFSDLMSSGLRTLKKPLRIRDVFEQGISAVSQAAIKKGVTLATHDRLDGERVIGDPHRLKVALVNVLDNAVKFTPAGGRIDAIAYPAENSVKIVVKDDGLGITATLLPHVFEQYRQGEHASTRHYGGLGLGLSLAEHIIRLHHGTIEAESRGTGAGSTFTISIPSA